MKNILLNDTISLEVGDIVGKYRGKRKIKKPVRSMSKIEKFIYSFSMIISLVISMAFFIYLTHLNKEIAFTDENTILYADRWTILLILPLFIFIIVSIICLFEETKSSGRPIFKRIKQKKSLSKNQKEWRTILIVTITTIGIILTLLAIGGIFGRISLLGNGHIQVYSITNNVKKEYTLGDFSQISVEYGQESVSRRNSRPTCYLNIETNNGKEFLFSMNDSRYSASDTYKNLENILNIKEYYEDNGISVSIDGTDRIEEIIEYYEMNDSEKEMLYDLFEIK